MSQTTETLMTALSSKFGSVIKSMTTDKKIVKIEVESGQIENVGLYLRNNHGWDHVKAVTAVDLSRASKKENKLEVIYHLGSYSRAEQWGQDLSISCKLDREKPVMMSLYNVWPSCEYHEREVFEMFGIIFEGHPNLGRLLLPEYWSDEPPLLKDYEPPGR